MAWRNVQGNRITCRRGKTGIGADLPIHEELAPELGHVLRDQFLVDAKPLNKVSGQPFRIAEIEDAIAEMLA